MTKSFRSLERMVPEMPSSYPNWARLILSAGLGTTRALAIAYLPKTLRTLLLAEQRMVKYFSCLVIDVISLEAISIQLFPIPNMYFQTQPDYVWTLSHLFIFICVFYVLIEYHFTDLYILLSFTQNMSPKSLCRVRSWNNARRSLRYTFLWE